MNSIFLALTGSLLFLSTYAALSPVQLAPLKQQFSQAITNKDFTQARALIEQLNKGQQQALAREYQAQLDAALVQNNATQVRTDQQKITQVQASQKAAEQNLQQLKKTAESARKTDQETIKQLQEALAARDKTIADQKAAVEKASTALKQLNQIKTDLTTLSATTTDAKTKDELTKIANSIQ